MSFFGNVLSFENFKLGNMWDKIKKNPEQLLLGAGDPFSAKVWGGITGKDYEPLVDQWGGATKDDYAKAEAKGIDTGAGKTMHGLAKMIAGSYAGGYGAQQMGMGGAAAGQGGQSLPAGATDVPMPTYDPTSGKWLQSGTAAVQGSNGGSMAGFGEYAKQASDAMGMASQARGLLDQPDQPVQHAQMNRQPVDFSSLLSVPKESEDWRQKRLMREQSLLGGYRG